MSSKEGASIAGDQDGASRQTVAASASEVDKAKREGEAAVARPEQGGNKRDSSNVEVPMRPKRSVSSANAVTQYPVHVKLRVRGDEVLRGDSRGVTTEKHVPGETERRQTWIYEWIDGLPEAFLLKSAKTSQYLGVLSRGGQTILHLFEFSFNRSRELAFVKVPIPGGSGGFRFRNVASGLYIGGVSTRPKTLGCVLMTEEEDEGEGGERLAVLSEEVVKTAWSFNSKGKALTCQANASLAMHNKGVFSWSPYFEFVAAPGNVVERFYLRPARPASEDMQYVSVGEDGKVSLARHPCAFNLVPTLKSGSFFVRDCISKRLLRVSDAATGLVVSTESTNVADTFSLMDVKDVVFGGQRVLAGISEHFVRLKDQLEKYAKHPIAHPVYSHLPSVFEREMSYFAALYFIARCNNEKGVLALCAEIRPLLDSREKVLLANVDQSFNMIPVIMNKDTALFRALDKAVSDAKQAVSESDKLFSKYADMDPPHVTTLAQEDDDTFVRIALSSDFGSGKPKARQMLHALFAHDETRPHIFIHLGDVYKKGTRREQSENLIQPLVEEMGATKGEPVRVYALPGNHDYIHKGGDGYFWALDELKRLDLSKQSCSFFCLNIGSNYSIIGLDTGLGSLKSAESDALDVQINEEQREWLKLRMEECLSAGRRVIMLTHHPVLSSGPVSFGQVNANLWKEMSPYFSNIVAWFWGHEHSFS